MMFSGVRSVSGWATGVGGSNAGSNGEAFFVVLWTYLTVVFTGPTR